MTPKALFATLAKDLAPPAKPRPLAQTLPRIASAAAISPWTPREEAPPPAPPPPQVDVAAIIAEARAQGRAEGLAELAAQRERMAELIMAFELATERAVDLAAEQLADVVTTTIEAWTASTAPGVMLAPVMRAWLARCASEPATARVHPSSVGAARAALDGAPVDLVADPTLGPADIVVRGGAFELSHRWSERLRDLRELVVASLTEAADEEQA